MLHHEAHVPRRMLRNVQQRLLLASVQTLPCGDQNTECIERAGEALQCVPGYLEKAFPKKHSQNKWNASEKKETVKFGNFHKFYCSGSEIPVFPAMSPNLTSVLEEFPNPTGNGMNSEMPREQVTKFGLCWTPCLAPSASCASLSSDFNLSSKDQNANSYAQ